MTDNLFQTPDMWLREFLGNPNHVSVLNDDDGNPLPVKLFALGEITDPHKITLPSIIYTPGFEEEIETYAGTVKVAQSFTCDCRGQTFTHASEMREQAIETLNRIGRDNLFEYASTSFADLLDLSRTGSNPIYGCSFDLMVRY